MPQERRSYSKSFKAQVIAECAQPDTSIANVALTHNLNANLVHKWIRVHAPTTYGSVSSRGVKFPSADSTQRHAQRRDGQRSTLQFGRDG